jgi:two-component system NarL family sensor kinase
MTGHPSVVRDWRAEKGFDYPPVLRDARIRSSAVLPIGGRERPIGVLAAHAYEPDRLGTEEFAFLGALATLIATAVERQRADEEIAELAALRGRLVAENLEAEERTRRRISEALHDGALQDLLAARQDLVEALGRDDDSELIAHARSGVERAVRQLREAVSALHPVVLQHGGLAAAMQAAADVVARPGGFETTIAVDDAAAGAHDELVLSIARELLANAAKHADAEHVRITVRRAGDAVVLEVADDGRGIDLAAVNAAPRHGHIGLASLTQRVEAVGGSLSLESDHGRGTTVRATLPIG